MYETIINLIKQFTDTNDIFLKFAFLESFKTSLFQYYNYTLNLQANTPKLTETGAINSEWQDLTTLIEKLLYISNSIQLAAQESQEEVYLKLLSYNQEDLLDKIKIYSVPKEPIFIHTNNSLVPVEVNQEEIASILLSALQIADKAFKL